MIIDIDITKIHGMKNWELKDLILKCESFNDILLIKNDNIQLGVIIPIEMYTKLAFDFMFTEMRRKDNNDKSF